MKRIPVVFRGLPLMPMKASRARRFVLNDKAKIMFDRKLNIHYLKLLVEPSDIITQEITLGCDLGSTFDGFSLLSKLFHHLNIELIQRPKLTVTKKLTKEPKPHKNSVRAFMTRKAMNRRVRRGRLRHRKIRFGSRTKCKIPPTIRANIDFRKWLIVRLLKYLPITKVRVEDVCFNHYRDLVGKNRLSGQARGASFSLVEVGKFELYDWLEQTGFTLETMKGFETCELRTKYLGGVDVKSKDKSSKSFNAHCLDSFIIGSSDYDTSKIKLNQQTIFIEKVVKQRRSLTLTRADYKEKKYYFRYGAGGIKNYFTNMSRKKNVCRVKLKDSHSNHPKEWEYIDNGYAEKLKASTSRYGGTSFNGERKFFKNNEWFNRKIEVIN